MRLRSIPVLLLLALPFLPLDARGQGPSADWRTLTTAHFRVHYPTASEGWARRAAARLESIRERVAAEVGYAPPEVVDVLVSDPVADANGMAYPILGWPRLVLWTSPPAPESELGHYSDWSDLLIVHEETHLAHLLRPSRNPLRQRLARLAPVGPIPLAAPRWVIEGYATVIEGRLTAAGRPNGDLRAAILRRWAQTGKLPSYARLASDTRSWHGMSMAYLMGSAYLEWLEERSGPGSLRKLWARMTARTPRSFDEAFRGVFGESPPDLYGRFCAELTWRAVEAERRLAGRAREGELWQELSWTVGPPALSPDGKELAIELGARDEPPRLAVWSTAPSSEAETKQRERLEKMLARDPLDVAPIQTKPPERKPLHVLTTADGSPPTTPRWAADGRSLLCVRFMPDRQGFLHPDLFRWTPGTGELLRLTRQADLREPDPSPLPADADWAVAVRNRDGASAVVRIDLKTRVEKVLAGPSLDEVYDRPRLSPDGRRVVFARHREGAWRLVVLDLASRAETVLAPPADSTVASPSWSPDGRTVYAAVGDRGFIDLWAFPADGRGAAVRLTRTQTAALAPAPAPDGKALFYLALESHGLDLRRLELPAAPAAEANNPAEPQLTPDLAPAIRPTQPPPPTPFLQAEVTAGRPYNLGRQEVLPLLAGSGSSAGSLWEAGVRSGDVVGRLEVLALGSFSRGGWPSGGALAGLWRGWPVAVGLHLFSSREEPTEQRTLLPGAASALDLDRRGAELSAAWERRWSGGRLSLRAAALAEDVEPLRREGGPSVRREVGSLSGTWAERRRWREWRLDAELGGHWEPGRTDGVAWERYGGSAQAALQRKGNGLSLAWRRDASGGTFRAYDLYQLGGTESSLLPRTATAGLIASPALPFGVLTGTDHLGERAELALDFLPAPLFYERHRLGSDGRWLSLAGMEWRWSTGPIPIGRVPALDFRLGVARVLGAPSPLELLDGDVRWWLTAVWRP